MFSIPLVAESGEGKEMDLRSMLKKDFGVDLPISGGSGNAITNPIVVHRQEPNDYVGVEYAILKFLGIGRGISWQMLTQELTHHNDRVIDKIRVETVRLTAEEEVRTVEAYYFDITECYGRR